MNKTVLVTGGTGYIGSWVVKKLLEKGHTVRLTVRDKNRREKYDFLKEVAEGSTGKLEIYEADLLKDGSFDKAAKGSDAIMHIASPFTLKFKDPIKDLIIPAVEGTKNVLSAAMRSGTVKKIVLTSSVAAVHGDTVDMKELGLDEFTEEHFNESSSEKHQPYSYSKVLAEKEAWKIYKEQNLWELAVMNPSFVMGPSLTPKTNSGSIVFMRDMLSGKMFMGVPDLEFGYVDVRDVAEAHILGLEKREVRGRYILVERVVNLIGFSKIIGKIYPKRFKLPAIQTPKLMALMFGWMFGQSFKFISQNVGYPLKLNNEKSIKELGLKYTPLETTLKEMIEQMEKIEII